MLQLILNNKTLCIKYFLIPGLKVNENDNFHLILKANHEFDSVENFIIDNLTSKRPLSEKDKKDLTKLSVSEREFWDEINKIFDNNKFLKSSIVYAESGSVLFVEESNRIRSCNFFLKKNSTLSLGYNSMINGRSEIYVGENSFCIIGAESLLAGGLRIRTNDGHTVVLPELRSISNNLKTGVIVGDHVWIGENCTINKNSFIGSNNIVASNSLLQNKVYPSYCLHGGIPAKTIKRDVTFDSRLVISNPLNFLEVNRANLFKDVLIYNRFKEATEHLGNQQIDKRIKYLLLLSKEKFISRFYVANFNFVKNLKPIDLEKYNQLIESMTIPDFVEKNKYLLLKMFIKNTYL